MTIEQVIKALMQLTLDECELVQEELEIIICAKQGEQQ